MQNNDKHRDDLAEMTATLRQLSLDERKKLMNFIIQEREQGVFYLHKEMMHAFLSGYCVNPLDGKALTLFSEKIKRYANILVDLTQEELDALFQSIRTPDTEKEIQQKAKRHKKIKKMVSKLYKRHQKRGNIFSRMLKKASHFATTLFSRQINESEKLGLGVFTEKDFNTTLKNILQPEQNEELAFISMLKQSNVLSPKLMAHAILSIEKGDFDIQKTDANGDTILHIAVQKEGMEKLVVALINNGADLTAMNNAGQTPINLAHCEKMRQTLKKFNMRQEDLSQKKVAYFQQLTKNEKIIPISQNDLAMRFPTPILTVQDILSTPKTNTLNYSEKFAENALPYIDETGNKITFIHPSEQKIAEHHSKQLLQQHQGSIKQENQNG